MTLRHDLEYACTALREVFGADNVSCALAIHHPGEASIATIMAVSGTGASAVRGMALPVEFRITGVVIGSGLAVEVPDLSKDERYVGQLAVDVGYEPRSLLCVPVATGHTTVGSLNVCNPGLATDTGLDLQLLQVAAAQLAQLCDRDRLRELIPRLD